MLFSCYDIIMELRELNKLREDYISSWDADEVRFVLVEPFNSILNQPGWQKSDACVY